MSALPLRSTQPRMPARFSTMKTTRKAFNATMATSTIMMLRRHPTRALITDRFVVDVCVLGNFAAERREDLRRRRVTALVAGQLEQAQKNLAVLERAFGRDQRRIQLLQPSFAVGVGAVLL